MSTCFIIKEIEYSELSELINLVSHWQSDRQVPEIKYIKAFIFRGCNFEELHYKGKSFWTPDLQVFMSSGKALGDARLWGCESLACSQFFQFISNNPCLHVVRGHYNSSAYK